mmetsp:Transcript_20461/g.40924  ORF Transcript_20461/g.40924 Transcript_20461/m.40924 type:complete len:488 (+) Transcript_20461:167-1630(+)
MLRPRVLLPTFSAASAHNGSASSSDGAASSSGKGHDNRNKRATRVVNIVLIIGLTALTLSLVVLHNAEDAASASHSDATTEASPVAPSAPLSSQTTGTEMFPNPLKDYRELPVTYPASDPSLDTASTYPELTPLSDLYSRWPQNSHLPSSTFREHLRLFDFQDPDQMAQARRLRDMELPFKVHNVPEIDTAGDKWKRRGYLSEMLDGSMGSGGVESARRSKRRKKRSHNTGPAASEGGVSYSVAMSESNFFTWFDGRAVDNYRRRMDPTYVKPTKPVSMSSSAYFERAIKKDLTETYDPDSEHLYMTLGVNGVNQRRDSKHTFIHHDLPSFITPPNNFFVFDFDHNKGVQCRFGERGVTAAAHYDNGRNMVAMVVGAKRYTLLPPKECDKLHVITEKDHPSRRHILLNFGDMDALPSDAKGALAVETIVKEGEVLYIPARWFHYITSLQFNAQCNSRSGRLDDESEVGETVRFFGGKSDIELCTTSD